MSSPTDIEGPTGGNRGAVIALSVCAVVGAIAGYVLLGDEWAAWRRVLGGAFGGLGIAILIFASRWIG